ncbi:unnamed protein product [Schistosoma margrebowiei]|uniref:Uncharacterized protein n=1 Tax=Schistosoma margrebowiei TaxID=48269 RepID=A0A183LCC6_9TREM|nr:unnamed protein product [Schistosoma margrebowiei]
MSRQFYCMGWKLAELQKLSSRRHKCLLTVVYAKYFECIGQTLLSTTYCDRAQSRSQRRKKSGSAGSALDTHRGKHQPVSQEKPSHRILKAKGEEEYQRTHQAEKWRQTFEE